ncbi:MAG: hypothetical protein GEU80_04240 [Dehalococcoidia bacterium]|nr:hypothetical protein [Dehalococcoidia bacterium]
MAEMLREGQTVSVLPKGDGLSASYVSFVRSVSADALRISVPARDGATLALEPGRTVSLFAEQGAQVYRMEGRVRVVEAEGDAVVLDPPSRVERIERREFYRLEQTLEPRYTAVVDEAGDEVRRLEGAALLDLSGGGLQLRTRDVVEPGANLRIILPLDDNQEIDVCARVLSTVAPDAGRTFFRVHGQFIDIPRAHQERIVRFVFRKQVEQRQRRAG